MNAFAVSLVVVLSLASLGVAAWTWMALTSVSETLGRVDLDGMHFDVE
jgi:hypothetical protein